MPRAKGWGIHHRVSDETRAKLRAARARQAEKQTALRLKREAEGDAEAARKFHPILARLCKAQYGRIYLDQLLVWAFVLIVVVFVVVMLWSWNRYTVATHHIRCSNGYVWTEWCGCQPPVYGDDC